MNLLPNTEEKRDMSITLLFSILLSISLSWAMSFSYPQTFIQCMSTQFGPYTKFVETIYTPNSSLYSYLLQSSQKNPRWLNSSTPKPLLILTPFQESEIQSAWNISWRWNCMGSNWGNTWWALLQYCQKKWNPWISSRAMPQCRGRWAH